MTETLLCYAYLYLCKCTGVQALSFCTIRSVHRRSRSKALYILDHSRRRGWVVSRTSEQIYTRESPVLIVEEGSWFPGPVWTGADNLASTGIRNPDRPARSSVAMLTELPDPMYFCRLYIFINL